MLERLETQQFNCDFETILSGQYDFFAASIDGGDFDLESGLLKLVVSSADPIELDIYCGSMLNVEFTAKVCYETRLVAVEDKAAAKFETTTLIAFDVIDISVKNLANLDEYLTDIKECLEIFVASQDIRVECKLSKGPFDNLS